MRPLGVLGLGLFGLCVGSFLNVVAYRRPLGHSFVAGRSQCTNCHSTIAWYDDVPVLSWLALRGRCRRCASPISVLYPLGEALTGAAFALLAWRIDRPLLLVVCLVLLTGVLAVLFTRLRHRR